MSLKCVLTSPTNIKAYLYSPLNKETYQKFMLLTDRVNYETLRIVKVSAFAGGWVYDLQSYNEIILGHQYEVILEDFQTVSLDVSLAINFLKFEDNYYYSGQDLGATYTPKQTSFVLWAPLASQVEVCLLINNQWIAHSLIREEFGIFRLNLTGNYDGVVYHYLVTNSGVTSQVTDPYAKGSTPNGENSVVINFQRLKIDLNEKYLPPINNYTEAIIYETSIRDFTSDPQTDIQHKGSFLGFVEEGRVNNEGHSVGFDYLKKLGITHVQLLPIYDFKTVDELYPQRFYNWGYDPQQYFVPEGSYASEVDNAYSRLQDLMTMVAELHKTGIRVVQDVVYNHVYQAPFSVFEKIVPGYYFRRKKDGRMSNGTFVGNEVASEKLMIRKMIIDACIYWVTQFGIDGFRFDLMGIMDRKTLDELKEAVRHIKPDFIFYGEGWNMPAELPEKDRGSMNNAQKLLDFAFFNDSFRETVKGGSMDDNLGSKGYLLGNTDLRTSFKYTYLGSSSDLIFPAKFMHSAQSVNYVECHDNGTLFDKLAISNQDEPIEVRYKRLALLNAVTMLAFGIPFFHQGQEIGKSKKGDLNSYKSGDKINRLDYSVVYQQPQLLKYFQDLVIIRKHFTIFKLTNPDDIEKHVQFIDLPEGGIVVRYKTKPFDEDYTSLIAVFNPSLNASFLDLKGEYQILFDQNGEHLTREILTTKMYIPPITFILLGQK